MGQPAEDGVELQQVRQGGVVGEVVDRHDLDVGAVALRLLRIQRPEEVAPDSTEAVDTYPDRHWSVLISAEVWCAPPTSLMGAGMSTIVHPSGSRKATAP